VLLCLLLTLGLFMASCAGADKTSPADVDGDADLTETLPDGDDMDAVEDETSDTDKNGDADSDEETAPDVEEDSDSVESEIADDAEGEEEAEADSDAEQDIPGPVHPAAGELIITEMMYDPLAGDDDMCEWLEIYNRTNTQFDLNGCVVGDSAHETPIETSLVIMPKGYILLGIDREQPCAPDVDWTWGTYNLGNGGDSFYLDCDGLRVDAVVYDEDMMPVFPEKGHSYALCFDAYDAQQNDDMRNWVFEQTPMDNGDFGTPRQVNPVCETPQWERYDCSPGDGDHVFPDCSSDMTLPGTDVPLERCVVVPDGQCRTFWIGTPEDRLDNRNNSRPQRREHLTGFSMLRTPVTVAMYRHCVEAGACTVPDNSYCLDWQQVPPSGGTTNYDQPGKDTHPVTCVTRHDAAAFCAWIGGSLPTEAQFEYASRGPMDTADHWFDFPWGDDDSDCHMNILGNDPFEQTSPVGFFNGDLWTREQGGWLFAPEEYQSCSDTSAFGIHDLTHNVLEFVLDGPVPFAQWGADRVNPVHAVIENGLLMRGSGWIWPEKTHAMSNNRDMVCPDCSVTMEADPWNTGGTALRVRCVFTH